MEAKILTAALDAASREPGALELHLIADKRATLFGRQDHAIPGLQELGLQLPTEQQLQALFDAMNKAADLLADCSSYFVAGTAVEVADLRAVLSKCSSICQEAPIAAFFAGDQDKGRRDRWFEICSTFSDWARKVEGYRPQDIPQAMNSHPDTAATEQRPACAQETGQIPARESKTGPRAIYHLYTAKNENEQRKIFAALARAGFIADTDPSTGASMERPFLNSFDAAATEQGRILWRGTSSKGGIAATPSPRQALDFVALMAGGIQGITPDFARDSFPAIFPGLCCSKSTRSRFIERWNHEKGSESHAALQLIVQSQ